MFACVGEEGGNWLANYLSLVQVIKKKKPARLYFYLVWQRATKRFVCDSEMARWMVANDFLRFYALVREIVETIVTLFFLLLGRFSNYNINLNFVRVPR